MASIALCIDTISAREPSLLELDGENLRAQTWLDIYSTAQGARENIRKSEQLQEVWVVSSDDMDCINLAAALKHDCKHRRVLMFAEKESGSLLSRASAAGIDATFTQKSFLQHYAQQKRKSALEEGVFGEQVSEEAALDEGNFAAFTNLGQNAQPRVLESDTKAGVRYGAENSSSNDVRDGQNCGAESSAECGKENGAECGKERDAECDAERAKECNTESDAKVNMERGAEFDIEKGAECGKGSNVRFVVKEATGNDIADGTASKPSVRFQAQLQQAPQPTPQPGATLQPQPSEALQTQPQPTPQPQSSMAPLQHTQQIVSPLVKEGKRAFFLPVVSGSGGAGKSTIATLAAFISQKLGYSTLLLDFDLQFGDIADMAGSPDALRIDSLLEVPTRINQLAPVQGKPAILAAPRRLEASDAIAAQASQLLDSLMLHFDVIVANTGSFWLESHALLLEHASKALFLVDQRSSSLKACKHALELCARCGIAANPFMFAANCCTKGALFSSLDISCALKAAHSVELKWGGKEVEELLCAGMPLELMNENNDLCESIEQVLRSILPQTPAHQLSAQAKEQGLQNVELVRGWFGRKKSRRRRGAA